MFVLPKICCMNLTDYEASFKLPGNKELAHIVQMPGGHLPEAVLAAQKELDARKVFRPEIHGQYGISKHRMHGDIAMSIILAVLMCYLMIMTS